MIIENASAILKKMGDAALRAGRSPVDVKLIAVTKKVDVEKIREALDAGIRMFGESRVQEAQKKISNLRFEISNPQTEWHLIGNLQKNKAKYAVQLFCLLHTVDSIELAEEINRQAEKTGKIQRVLVQVKLSEEESKHGVSEKKLRPLLDKISTMNNIKSEGLMTIPPFF